MTYFNKTAMALMFSAAFIGAGAGQANALTLMDLIRGGPANARPDAARPLTVAPGMSGNGPSAYANRATAARDVDPEPLPRVSGPRYYTYKADAQRLIDLSRTPLAAAGDATRYLAEARVSAETEVARAVEAYYTAGGAPIWVSEGALNARAEAAIALLQDSASIGLDPADYKVAAPSDVTASIAAVVTPVAASANVIETSRERAMMQFELALSVKALTYVQDTVRGRIDPNRISGYHDFVRKSVNLGAVLKNLSLSPDAGAYLASRSPSGPQFTALKQELARLRAEDAANDGQQVSLPSDLVLKPGSGSTDMQGIVSAIGKRSSDTLRNEHSVTLASYRQTPEYTPELVDLVKAFQKERGLKADGVIGPATVRAMVGHSGADKINKLVVALEQARWLPDDLGDRYVFINQPAYMVYYHEAAREQFAMRVVIGAKANQTYFFQDEIQTVEYNPYWGVPQSIIVNEMLPKLRSDPSYLDRMGYQVAVGGKAVASNSVNWYGSTQNISVRQPPSGDNALGELKILFPNSHAIYMHDTPSKSFFQRDFRALSHGCVRLADPRRMAAAVTGTSVEDVARQIATGKNRAVQVPSRIPIYVSYFTAWPDKNDSVQYFDDVYDRDSFVMKAFAATSKARAS